jgi:hypothetical protein
MARLRWLTLGVLVSLPIHEGWNQVTAATWITITWQVTGAQCPSFPFLISDEIVNRKAAKATTATDIYACGVTFIEIAFNVLPPTQEAANILRSVGLRKGTALVAVRSHITRYSAYLRSRRS